MVSGSCSSSVLSTELVTESIDESDVSEEEETQESEGSRAKSESCRKLRHDTQTWVLKYKAEYYVKRHNWYKN